MPSIEELLAKKAKVNEEFQKKEVEEKERVEEKQKAEEEEKKKVDDKWRMEELEEKKRKDEKARAAKDLADHVVANAEELLRSEGVRGPAISKVVVPWSIGGVLSLEMTAQQIVLEVVWKLAKIPKASGSRSMTNIVSDMDLNNPEDCSQCIHQGQRCMWELRGKAKSCIPCQDNKQRCELVRAGRGLLPLKRIMEEPEDMGGSEMEMGLGGGKLFGVA